VSHSRSFLATGDLVITVMSLSLVPLYEMAITDRLVSTVASDLLSCFTLILVAVNSDSYNLLRPDATLLYIYIELVISLQGCRIMVCVCCPLN